MKHIIYCIAITLALVSCENEMPFNVKASPQELILNALLNSEAETNIITVALTGRDNVTYVNDATVKVYINGQLKEQITASSNEKKKGVYHTHVKFVPDDIVKVEASTSDGLFSAWGEALVPTPIAIQNVDTSRVVKQYPWTKDIYLRTQTTFTDNGQAKNFYRIVAENHSEIKGISRFTGSDTTVNYSYIPYLDVREDVVLTDGRPTTHDDDNSILIPIENRYGVFDNSRINGMYTMTTSTQLSYNYYYPVDTGIGHVISIRHKTKLRLLSISKMQYYYLKAINIFDTIGYDDYFNMPVKFPSNIEGGIGIVGVSTENSVMIDLGEVEIDY